MIVANLCNLQFFGKCICAHRFDWSTNPILLKIERHVRYTMMHVWNNRFNEKIVLVIANLGNKHFLGQIYLLALFWLIYYIHHINNCIHLSTLRWATISNTVICTLHDFVISEVRFIHTSTVRLLDRILVTEKNTRTPRVHLVILFYNSYCHIGCIFL